MTEKQSRVVPFVASWWQTHGYAPSIRDVMVGCGYQSESATHRALKLEVDAGRLLMTPGISRSIRIRPDVWAEGVVPI